MKYRNHEITISNELPDSYNPMLEDSIFTIVCLDDPCQIGHIQEPSNSQCTNITQDYIARILPEYEPLEDDQEVWLQKANKKAIMKPLYYDKTNLALDIEKPKKRPNSVPIGYIYTTNVRLTFKFTDIQPNLQMKTYCDIEMFRIAYRYSHFLNGEVYRFSINDEPYIEQQFYTSDHEGNGLLNVAKALIDKKIIESFMEDLQPAWEYIEDNLTNYYTNELVTHLDDLCKLYDGSDVDENDSDFSRLAENYYYLEESYLREDILKATIELLTLTLKQKE